MAQNSMKINKGVTITPPVIGRIMMGHTELRVRNGETRAIPKRDDHFALTTLVQQGDRLWERHPIERKLSPEGGPITTIPVRLAYNDPGLTMNNRYTAFDSQKGRPLCVGDGDKAKRVTENGIVTIDCPRAGNCTFGEKHRCKNMSRAYFQIDGQEDELGVFVLRTTSHNTLDAIAGQLARLYGLTNGVLAGMPLQLEIVSKTSTQSMRTVFYFARLTLRAGMSLAQTLKAARDYQTDFKAAGLDLDGMENAMRAGLGNSDFADELEDLDEWLSDEDVGALAAGNLERATGSGGLPAADALLARLKSQGTQAANVAAPSAPDSGAQVSTEPVSPPPAVAATSVPESTVVPAEAVQTPEPVAAKARRTPGTPPPMKHRAAPASGNQVPV